jgi:hypothetical protein
LEKIAKSFGTNAGASQVRESELIITPDINEPKAKSETKNNSKPNQKSDGSEVVMYRGVRIRR